MTCYPKNKPPGRTTDGVYLVNCFKGNERSSGIAWYKNLGNNDGKQPDAYIDTQKGGNTIWEGTPGSGKNFVKWSCEKYLLTVHTLAIFPDKNIVAWQIDPNAQTEATYALVGSAKNNFELWNVYKDKYRLLYEVDGWQCYTVYWCV